jgi:hypothetical protein
MVAEKLDKLVGKSVGDGQCVAFVRGATGLPDHRSWKQGLPVKGASLPRGTAIATFDAEGKYPSHKTGNHAALYDGQDSQGIWVYDQWKNDKEAKPVHRRHIPSRNGVGPSSNDGAAGRGLVVQSRA